ncbi:F-box protein CPR1-like [Papaver somniferum]|uniref:F-box protein CPR1-like n=1 Tax=Papaver somniferum TaxID=3469 RepID=UPI000E6F710D|nr:F-box protein CPR1-like [Papaver somniferum]
MSSIPEEIYHEILMRLPVKSILACTSKVRTGIYDVGYDSFLKESEFDEAAAVEMHSSKSSNCTLRGSCNGLVLLSFYKKELTFFQGELADRYNLCLCLSNPATREYKELPESPKLDSFERLVIYGFGYDYKNDDYKLFKIIMQTIPYWFSFVVTSGVLVPKALHWLVSSVGSKTRPSPNVIISLDISNERFDDMLLPKELSEKRNMTVGVLESCLCVLHLKQDESDVWVMQEYGVQESWTKQYSITLGFHSKISYLRLIWSSKNGKMLLQTNSGFFLYDLKNSSAIETTFGMSTYCDLAENYVESLVSLNSNTQRKENQKKRKHEEEA